jgi:hypothetical protein
MFPINVEKKNTIARSISSFKNVKNNAQRIRSVISIFFIINTPRNNTACNNTIKAIVPENPKNFQSIKSCLLIGLDNIKNIVFPSISLNKS